MKKWLIILIVAAVLVGVGVYVFRERPFVPEGYTVERVGGALTIDDGTSAQPVTRYWETGQTLLQYNSGYPNVDTQQYLTISTDELETMLKTANCRISLHNYTPFFSRGCEISVYCSANQG